MRHRIDDQADDYSNFEKLKHRRAGIDPKLSLPSDQYDRRKSRIINRRKKRKRRKYLRLVAKIEGGE